MVEAALDCFQLQTKVTSCLAKYKPGAQIRTDFTTFPTPQFAKVCFIHSARFLHSSLAVVFKFVEIFVDFDTGGKVTYRSGNTGHAPQSNNIAVIIILILIGRKVTNILGEVRELNF